MCDDDEFGDDSDDDNNNNERTSADRGDARSLCFNAVEDHGLALLNCLALSGNDALVAAIVDVLVDLTGATCTLSACAANSQFHRSIERCVLALLGKQHGSPSNTFRVLAKHLLRLMTDTGGKGAVNRAREAAFEFSSPPWKTPR